MNEFLERFAHSLHSFVTEDPLAVVVLVVACILTITAIDLLLLVKKRVNQPCTKE